jgi:hypothetical protein
MLFRAALCECAAGPTVLQDWPETLCNVWAKPSSATLSDRLQNFRYRFPVQQDTAFIVVTYLPRVLTVIAARETMKRDSTSKVTFIFDTFSRLTLTLESLA